VQTVELDEEALRDVFNGAGLWEKRIAGDLMEVVDRNSTPRLETSNHAGLVRSPRISMTSGAA
jgi:hypothetical protein